MSDFRHCVRNESEDCDLIAGGEPMHQCPAMNFVSGRTSSLVRLPKSWSDGLKEWLQGTTMIGEADGMANRGDRRDKTKPRATKTTRKALVQKRMPGLGVRAVPSHIPSQPRPFHGFDRERATYHRVKPDLLVNDEGKYVVIVGDEIVGPLGSHEEAERAGYDRFGLGPLYVKQVLAEEPVVELTRLHHS
jgi:hypothetical protein